MSLSDSLQCGERARADLLDRSLAQNLAVARRVRVALRRPLRIIVDQRPGLLLVDLQALSHRFLLVVLALHQGLARQIVLARHFRGIEGQVIVAPGGRMHAAAAQAPDDLLVIDLDLEHKIEVDARCAHGVGLRDGARKAVEQVAVPAIHVLQTVLHQADDDLVGDQLSRVHHLLGRDAQRSAGLHRRAQHVAGGNLRDPEVVPDESRLRALTGARRPEKNEPHFLSELPREGVSSDEGRYRLWLARSNSARTRSKSSGVSTPGAGASCLTATAMAYPCHSARSCSSASKRSSGDTASLGNTRRNAARYA